MTLQQKYEAERRQYLRDCVKAGLIRKGFLTAKGVKSATTSQKQENENEKRI